ncbi:glucose-1-phosphate cytidylyltransferase [Gammaproteobacteria bacterium]|nr:glucose-1-phosphate cytidylyltransferase [Gammaproteobacteria bacterium]
MKVIILAGGLGTRISEYTQAIPKPMVKIGELPILMHIMNFYASYGHNDFLLALGYKSEIIKKYFLDHSSLNSDFEIDLKTGVIKPNESVNLNWKVGLFDTGLDTMTGGRVLRLKEMIGDETFMLTYGDGLSNVDLDKLVKFHKSHGKMITVSAVHPIARFGEIQIEEDQVKSFKEKPQLDQGWINGGFFVIEPEFFDYIEDDTTILERQPLEKVTKEGELMAYTHDGFWHCMDTVRDKDLLEEIWQAGDAPWIVN